MGKNAKKDEKSVQNVAVPAEKPEETRIIYMDVADLKAYEKNPRKNGPAVEKVAASIREFGFKVPVVIDRDRTIICGHTRVMAARKLKIGRVPCIVADDLTEDQVRAYRLADNKVAEFAEWDVDLLEGELDAIGIDMTQFGFELSSRKEVVEDDFDPEPPEEPKSRPGQVYRLGRHRLMCGDSTSQADVKELVDGSAVDMLLTDPPYNVDYQGAAGKIKNDSMDSSRFRVFLANAFSAAKAVMKRGAVFHVWHSETEGYNFRGALADSGLQCRQMLVWVKSSQTLGRQDFQRMYEGVITGDTLFDPEMEENGYEAMLYGWKDGKGHQWFKKRREKDVLFFDKPAHSALHPTMKPVKLFDYEMQCNTKEGDIVLDLFGGSGTTVMAAEQNGRVAYVMEYDPKFVDVIIRRWEEFTGGSAELVEDSKTTQRDISRHDATTK